MGLQGVVDRRPPVGQGAVTAHWRVPVLDLLLRRDARGVAESVTDPAEVERVLRAMLRRFPRYGGFADVGVGPDGESNPADLARAIANGRVVVRVRLDGGGP